MPYVVQKISRNRKSELLIMITGQTIRRIIGTPQKLLPFRGFSSTINIEKLEQESSTDVDVIDEEAQRKEAEIERKRNKSRLRQSDRRFLFEQNPYMEPMNWIHGTLKYNRRVYGRYGQQSGVDPAICWPTKQELADAIEYESIAHPFTIPQMIETKRKEQQEKQERQIQRQNEIVEKMKKLDGWVKDMHDRIAKKEGEYQAAKERRERLVEEVRAHFGYTVDPKDERFQQLLEKKEKEQKKAMKEARRKAQEQKIMDKLTKKPSENKEIPADT